MSEIVSADESYAFAADVLKPELRHAWSIASEIPLMINCEQPA